MKIGKIVDARNFLDSLLDMLQERCSDKNYHQISYTFYLRGLCNEKEGRSINALSDFSNSFSVDPTSLDALEKIFQNYQPAKFNSNSY